jgi:hypothetical protein
MTSVVVVRAFVSASNSNARSVVERFEWWVGTGGVAGPSTAPFAKCANDYAQDDKFG